MKLGSLSRVVRIGMERARDVEVNSWIVAAEKQPESGKKIYNQVAQAVYDGINKAIEMGIESLLDDYDLTDGVIKSDTPKRKSKSLDLEILGVESVENQPPEEKKERKPRSQKKASREQPKTNGDGRRVHVL